MRVNALFATLALCGLTPGCVLDWSGTRPSADAGGDAVGPSDAGVDLPPDLPPPPGSWISVPGGTFMMGSPAGEPCRDDDGETRHQVTLSHRFELLNIEVDQDAYLEAVGNNPSTRKCGDCPVETVTWDQAAAYCNQLSAPVGLAPCYSCDESSGCTPLVEPDETIYQCEGYRLPTEAEWERAYRAGSDSALYNGPLSDCEAAEEAAEIAWYVGNAGEQTHAFAGRAPNAWGLYDMAGNVAEWCHDGYVVDLGAEPQTDPVRPPTTSHVTRGGSYLDDAQWLRAAARRQSIITNEALENLGFRCARTVLGGLQSVIDRIILPDSAAEFAHDADGDGEPENFVGKLLGALLMMVDLQPEVDRVITDGLTIYVFDLAVSPDAVQPRATLSGNVAVDLDNDPADNFSGEEVFVVTTSPQDRPAMRGSLRGTRLVVRADEIRFPLPLDTATREIQVFSATIRATVSSAGMADGVLTGLLPEAARDDSLLPLAAARLTELLQEQPSDTVKTLDANDDGKITVEEINSSIFSSLFKPDIDSDGDRERDSFSIGLGFTAVPCVIQRTP